LASREVIETDGYQVPESWLTMKLDPLSPLWKILLRHRERRQIRDAHLRDDRTIEVKELGDTLVITFPNPEWIMGYDTIGEHFEPLMTLPERFGNRVILLDFQAQILHLPCSFEANLLILHRRMTSDSRVLKLCNLSPQNVQQLTINHLIRFLNVYTTLEDAVNSPLDSSLRGRYPMRTVQKEIDVRTIGDAAVVTFPIRWVPQPWWGTGALATLNSLVDRDDIRRIIIDFEGHDLGVPGWFFGWSITAHKKMSPKGRSLCWCVLPSGAIPKVLNITKLDRLINVYASLDDALNDTIGDIQLFL
jgi:hypothetical protein